MADQEDPGRKSPAPDAIPLSGADHVTPEEALPESAHRETRPDPGRGATSSSSIQKDTPEQPTDVLADEIESGAASGAAVLHDENVLGLPDLVGDEPERATAELTSGIKMLDDVELDVTIELGRTQKTVEEVLQLSPGSVVELDRLAGDPVDILVNERLVARGEVLVLNENLCVRISEILPRQMETRPE